MLSRIRAIFNKPSKPTPVPVTHDYTAARLGWGHNLEFVRTDSTGMELKAMGWGRGINCGDYIVFTNGNGSTTRYQFASIKYFNDPSDMWSAKLTFAPRQVAAAEGGAA